jgi:hypothetical protein
MLDRTTKLMLALIILGLWGLLLRPVFLAVPTQAQQSQTLQFATPVLMVNPNTGGVYLAPTDGNLYLFDPLTLQLRARAVYNPASVVTRTGQRIPPTFTNP